MKRRDCLVSAAAILPLASRRANKGALLRPVWQYPWAPVRDRGCAS